MRIVICGAGAVGSALGGYLARAGVPVVLLGRGEHLHAVRRSGLLLGTADGEIPVEVPTVERAQALTWTERDRIVLTTKSQHTRALLASLEGAPRHLPLFCFQNGVRNEEWAAARFHRVYGAVVQISATIAAPGSVTHTRGSHVVLGRYPSGTDEEVERMAGALEAAGLDVVRDREVMEWKWGKLLLNLNNAVYALTDTWVERALADPDYRSFMAATMREGLEVARATGVRPRIEAERSIDAYIEELAKPGDGDGVLSDPRKDSRTYPSTWQDLQRGRTTTEVPHFNGEIVRLAHELGLAAPYNAVLLQRMDELVSAGRGPGGWALDALLADVRRRQASEAPPPGATRGATETD